MTFEELVAEIKALGLKWHEGFLTNEESPLKCERGDCAVGALLRARYGDSARHLNGTPGGMAKSLGLPEDLIARVVVANDYKSDVAPWGRRFSAEDRAYLIKELEITNA